MLGGKHSVLALIGGFSYQVVCMAVCVCKGHLKKNRMTQISAS